MGNYVWFLVPTGDFAPAQDTEGTGETGCSGSGQEEGGGGQARGKITF